MEVTLVFCFSFWSGSIFSEMVHKILNFFCILLLVRVIVMAFQAIMVRAWMHSLIPGNNSSNKKRKIFPKFNRRMSYLILIPKRTPTMGKGISSLSQKVLILNESSSVFCPEEHPTFWSLCLSLERSSLVLPAVISRTTSSSSSWCETRSSSKCNCKS